MSSYEEVGVIVQLRGTTEFIRNSGLVVGSMEEMQVAADETGVAMETAGKKGFFMNQALFTARRLAFGATLALVATGVEAIRLGFSFNSAMQQARVALRPVSHDIGGVDKRLRSLFNFTKYTPFQFKDVTIAFRSMYLGFRTVGISADTTQRTLKSMVDALSAAGRTSPGQLNRVAVALQHMAFQGHLTGYTVNQLARDGIPIFAALRKELHLTGEQMHSIGTLGIPSQVALAAINKFVETYPGTANMAYKQATGSLHGLFTTFKDNISQLMGQMETGVFNRMQNRLIRFNAFFSRFNERIGKGASLSSIIGGLGGGGAEMIWKALIRDLTLVWQIFSRVVGIIVRSRPMWAEFYITLVLIHGILAPVNFFLNHFGWLLTNLIVPALIAEYAITKLLIIRDTIRLYLLRATVATGREYTLGMFAARAAMIAYYTVLGRLIVAYKAVRESTQLWTVLMGGSARGANGQFRAMTSLEKVAFRLRTTFLRLFAPLVAITSASWAFTASLLANPITWIVLGIVALTAGLVILYMKWAPFRKLINETFGWLYHHPIAAMFVPVIGPLVAIAHQFLAIYHHLRDIYNLLRHPLRPGGGGSLLHRGLGFAGHLALMAGGGIPFMASGGTVRRGGTVLVGEQGPELLSLPSAAQVTPLNFAGTGATQGERQPIQINLMINRRVLESVMVDIINGRVANA